MDGSLIYDAADAGAPSTKAISRKREAEEEAAEGRAWAVDGGAKVDTGTTDERRCFHCCEVGHGALRRFKKQCSWRKGEPFATITARAGLHGQYPHSSISSIPVFYLQINPRRRRPRRTVVRDRRKPQPSGTLLAASLRPQRSHLSAPPETPPRLAARTRSRGRT